MAKEKLKKGNLYEVRVPFTALVQVEVKANSEEEAKEFLKQALQDSDQDVEQAMENNPKRIFWDMTITPMYHNKKELFGIKKVGEQ